MRDGIDDDKDQDLPEIHPEQELEPEQDLEDIDPDAELAAIGKRLEKATRAQGWVRCEEHGLMYDSAAGCSLCKAAKEEARNEMDRLRKGLMIGAVLLGIALVWGVIGRLMPSGPARHEAPKTRATQIPVSAGEAEGSDAEEPTPAPEEAAVPAGAVAPADPQAVAALRKAAAEAKALIQTAQEETKSLVAGGVDAGPADGWQAWAQSWGERVAQVRGGLPAQPGADADINLILAQQEVENALQEMDQLSTAKTSPPGAELQNRLTSASRALQDATESLDKIR
jgi:hypothetical protein